VGKQNKEVEELKSVTLQKRRNEASIIEWLGGKLNKTNKVSINYLYDGFYRVNIRLRSSTIISDSYFLMVKDGVVTHRKTHNNV